MVGMTRIERLVNVGRALSAGAAGSVADPPFLGTLRPPQTANHNWFAQSSLPWRERASGAQGDSQSEGPHDH